eukprot:CAMPEP_0194508846 /NCGR_PEP_ID=MMETSP0253-20130528/39148_1 /TAXON_ID=2966 /ORGANISM="Noctiluca scintillans" /LENGTH=109 /DNA_ID=CAMNT_0039351919 /DNA_START=59 /DNA_END=388 /DNA_ORIENTATION=+
MVLSLLLSVKAGCDLAMCPSQCYCAQKKCKQEIDYCDSKDRCEEATLCAHSCSCDSKQCLNSCATYFPWPEVDRMITCIVNSCSDGGSADSKMGGEFFPQERNITESLV